VGGISDEHAPFRTNVWRSVLGAGGYEGRPVVGEGAIDCRGIRRQINRFVSGLHHCLPRKSVLGSPMALLPPVTTATFAASVPMLMPLPGSI
jgi:hypothetical protein